MSRNKLWALALAAGWFALHCGPARADINVSENFTGATTQNAWYYFDGACLTAGTTDSSANPGTPPGCVADSYYTENLVGGYNGTGSTGSSGQDITLGSQTTLPDPTGDGALRFTNGCIWNGSNCVNGGKNQHGAIISENAFSTSQGLDITFKTVTYRGDSGGGNDDGADGMSFFLINGDTAPNIGSYGGSLSYSCSNVNTQETEPYHGMVGAYLGLGIDEYGNFLNGAANTLGETGTNANVELPYHDNTASGGYYLPNRIGLRGAGNIAWPWLSANYPTDYPAVGLTSQQEDEAVQFTCETGVVQNFSNPSELPTSPQTTGTSVMDYPAIPDAYAVVSSKIADEYTSGGYSRQDASPITYRLKITENGLLSLWYSYDGGSWIGVIANHNITDSNGALPATVRFGFAGSTGGSSNIHELLCFKATPAGQAASSSTTNQQQSSRVQNGSQIYFSYYDPSDWTGRLTANSLLVDSAGNLSVDSVANWDASCVLTGVASGASCPTTGQVGPVAAEAPGSRVILTWGTTTGIPFEWSSLTGAERNALDAQQTTSGITYDSTVGGERLDYLRGDRSNEITTSGSGLFRDRDSVLADIVDSSPAWVGPPSKSIYTAYETPSTWKDKLYPAATMPENSGQSFTQYVAAEATRLNVVYVGADDGLLHGFAAGSYDSTGTVYDSSTNTGEEVLAYMPQSVLEDIHSATNANVDYSNPQYGHNFYVDATPGTGDLYYGGAWHTWLVSGLGAGGAEIFALDVTHPSNFSESDAASLVIGDWTPTSLVCANVGNCGQNLGDTYGTPVIRRLHNGDWGIIFGNGIGSQSGDAGIYVMTVDPSTGAITTYYLSTGQAGKNDGIAYVYPVDMDGDHVTDYVYAGDVNGNVWRFDLTSNSASNWAVSPGPIFTTPAGQPITTAVQPDFVTGPTGQTMLMLYFGTGRKFPITNTSPTTYQGGTQAFYGVWDWNMSGWNAHNLTQFASLSSGTVAALTSLSSPYVLGAANLQQQTISIDPTTGDRLVSNVATVCWAGATACSGNNDQFGWYVDLPGSNSGYSQSTNEQLIFNPEIVSTAVVFDSFLPGIDSPLACSTGKNTGWLYALDVLNGGPVTSTSNGTTTDFFLNNGNVHTIAFEADASGSPTEVTTNNSSGSTNAYLVYQSLNGGAGTPVRIQPQNDVTGQRLTWVELR